MSRANAYQLIARVASASDPGDSWDVKTDGTRLTCGCPIWKFNRQPDPVTGARSCRHVREVEPRVRELGGIQAALAALRRSGAVESGLGPGLSAGSPRRRPGAAVAPARPEVLPIVGACDLDCGSRFFGGAKRCRHGRSAEEGLATVAHAAERQQPQWDEAPDWLGGHRNIILREED